jgi:ribosomal protein S18 acetylase RimI-like enzyme
MLALEARVISMGLDVISLHVFGHNRAARSLYEKLGYETTNVYMSKKLSIGETIHD